jgi:hypothetical protein
MHRNYILIIFIFTILNGQALNASSYFGELLPTGMNPPDTLKEDQILYNGIAWRNQYYMMKGDQFLFSKEFLPGSLTINGNFYQNILINYDIYNDEILTPKNHGNIVQLNKEMVDSFTLVSGGVIYRFVNTQEDSLPEIKGYANELYRGKCILFVKYKKEIQQLAVDDKYDLFYQTFRIYLLKEGKINQITGKKGLLKLLQDEKNQVKSYMKKNRLRVTKKEPASFIPVIRYYDSLSR